MAKPDDIIGGWIRNAEQSGEIKNLPGYGQPLELDDDSHVPRKYRMAYRVLKNAGITPPEVDLIKEIAALRKELDETVEPSVRDKLQIDINKLQQKLDVALDKFRHPR